MIRPLLPTALIAAALIAVPAIAAPKAAPKGAARPWTAVVAPVTTGSYLIGNPKARVRLVEYLSYTCPHCAHFAEQSNASLKAMVASGTLAIEVRNQVHDGIDLVAATLARCVGPAAYVRYHDAVLAQQATWFPRGAQWAQANAAQIDAMTDMQRMRAMADNSGLTDIARAAGASGTTIDACFTNDVFARRTVTASNATAKVRGTPAFEIDGRLVENVDWAALQPQLRAAGAK